MGPPVWVRLYAATGDEKYLNFAIKNWWRTSDYLYDKDEHLYFRDSTLFPKKPRPTARKFSGGRGQRLGDGWPRSRALQYMPMNHPDRPRFEQQFKDMAAKILSRQQSDGLWRASLLDPASYPLKETSSSSFYTYALAWGVNQAPARWRTISTSAVKRPGPRSSAVWTGEGKLTHVQPIGADPKKFAEEGTEVYGVGAFLLAGSELYRMAVMETAGAKAVKVSNPANFWREGETVELNLSGSMAVMDGVSARVLDSQSYHTAEGADKLLFQVDLAPGETRTFYVFDQSKLAAVPSPIVKTFARFVPERYDDFAWESDRIAHRTYGLALIPAEGTISSAPDVWIKKDRQLIVDVMYATKHYHADNGSFIDDYRVGHSRGCGGVGIWDGKNFIPPATGRRKNLSPPAPSAPNLN